MLEIHVWGSQADNFEKPDRLIFDLDPDPSVDWSDVVKAAREIRVLLQGFELESFLKTTGGRGCMWCCRLNGVSRGMRP
ncbi:MAG: hypothetical protein U0903_01290 [Planctomycetales bacterium]